MISSDQYEPMRNQNSWAINITAKETPKRLATMPLMDERDKLSNQKMWQNARRRFVTGHATDTRRWKEAWRVNTPQVFNRWEDRGHGYSLCLNPAELFRYLIVFYVRLTWVRTRVCTLRNSRRLASWGVATCGDCRGREPIAVMLSCRLMNQIMYLPLFLGELLTME